MLFLSFVSYLSYLKQTVTETDINFKGMIDKLMNKIEEYSESETEQEQPDSSNMLDELNKQNKTSGLMKNLLGDIKNVLTDGTDTKISWILVKI